MNGNFIREVIYYEDYYNLDFFNSHKEDVKKKIQLDFDVDLYSRKNSWKFFKHITGTEGIFEVRVEVGSDIFRVFSFFDKENLVVLIHGLQNKTQKTPKSEIKVAERLKKEYLEHKYKK